jgi:glycerol-3-phosphate O-acyltransferase / dihydroxyacetone phosphate acyltransferase
MQKQVVRTMSQLYSEGNTLKESLAARSQLNRDILKCYTEQKDQDNIVLLAKEVLRYKQQLNALQIRDHDVKSNALPHRLTHLTVAYKLSILILLSVLTLPGLVLFAPVFLRAKYYSEENAKFLTSISSNRIMGRDTLATSKILSSLSTAPILYTMYTALLVGGLYHYQPVPQLVGLSIRGAVLLSVFVLICLSLITVSSLYIGDRVVDIWKSLRLWILSLAPSNVVVLKRLQEQRKDLSRKVTYFINTSQAYRTFEAEITPTSAFIDQDA